LKKDKIKQVLVRLAEKDYTKLASLAEEDDRTVAGMARRLLLQALSKMPDPKRTSKFKKI
jgi:hypothetical protein